MLKIINFKDYEKDLDIAINYYYKKWGNNNFHFFNDAIRNSSNGNEGLPRFYLLLENDEIIGCGSLVTNDFISRHDLMPWLAGLFIEEEKRGKELGNYIMNFLEKEAMKIGFSCIYLTTNHNGYYEKYGWTRINDGFELSGEPTRIYKKIL